MPQKKANPKVVAGLLKDTGVLKKLAPLIASLSQEVGSTDFSGTEAAAIVQKGFTGVPAELKGLLGDLFATPRSREQIVELLRKNPLAKKVIALLTKAEGSGSINQLAEAAFLSKTQPFTADVSTEAPVGEEATMANFIPSNTETPDAIVSAKEEQALQGKTKPRPKVVAPEVGTPTSEVDIAVQARLKKLAKASPKLARALARESPELAATLGLDPTLLSPALAKSLAASKLLEGLSPVEIAKMEEAGFGIPQGVTSVDDAIRPMVSKLVALEKELPEALKTTHASLLRQLETAVGEARQTGSLAPLQKTVADLRQLITSQEQLKETEAATAAENARQKRIAELKAEGPFPTKLSSEEKYARKLFEAEGPRAAAERAGYERRVLERMGKVSANKGILDKAMKTLMGDVSWESIKKAGAGFPSGESIKKLGGKALRAAPAFFILQGLMELMGAKREQMESGWKTDLLRQMPTRTTEEALEDIQNERFLQGQGLSAVTAPNPQILAAVRQMAQPRLSTGEFIAGQNPLIAGLREAPEETMNTLQSLMTSSLT